MDTIEFGKKLKAVREFLGFNQGEFAKSLDLKQGSYSMVENGKALLSSKKLFRLKELHNVNLNWLISDTIQEHWQSLGIDSAFTRQVLPKTEKTMSEMGISQEEMLTGKYNLVIPSQARAGYTHEWSQEYLEDQIQICNIPGIHGRARTFEVTGESMEPIITEGDFICCTAVEDPSLNIKDGNLYVIITSESGIYIKYLKKTTFGVTCISSNAAVQKPFNMSYKEITEVWEAKVKLIYDLYSDQNRNLMPVLITKLHEMEEFMRKKHNDYPKNQD